MPNETVLVVEEERDALQEQKEGLIVAGYRVLATVDGAGARQLIREERPDAVILDSELSITSSLDVCKQIKGDSSMKHIPVFIVGTKVKLDDLVAALDVGAHDCITRKADIGELLARLGAAVRLKQSSDRLQQRNAKLEALAKHVRAAVQHYEQPQSILAPGVELEEGVGDDGRAIVRLTRRETEILQLLARGLSNEAISKQLYISPTTTRNHIQNILSKLGVHSKLEAVAYAVRAGYVDFVG